MYLPYVFLFSGSQILIIASDPPLNNNENESIFIVISLFTGPVCAFSNSTISISTPFSRIERESN